MTRIGHRAEVGSRILILPRDPVVRGRCGREMRSRQLLRRARNALVCTENLIELMTRRNRLSCWNDRDTLFRLGRLGLAIQVEVAA
jgi:hypothetical protein